MAAPFVTGTAALILSLNENLTYNQIKDSILSAATNISVALPNSIHPTSYGQTKKLNSFEALKYALFNYASPTYNISSSSNVISNNAYIDSGSEYLSKNYSFIKLEVLENIDAVITYNILNELTIYNHNMQPINFSQIESYDNFSSKILVNLRRGKYLVRSSFINESSSGSITTTIEPIRNVNLIRGTNNEILNYVNNGITNFIYYNIQGPCVSKISLLALSNNSEITYTSDMIQIKDSNGNLLNKISNIEASNVDNSNSLYYYFNSNQTIYIDVILPNNITYTSVILRIDDANNTSINLKSNILYEYNENILSSNTIGDNIKEFTINLKSKFTITYSLESNSDTFLNTKIVLFNKDGIIYLSTLSDNHNERIISEILDAGSYYIGYYNNLIGDTITINIERIIQSISGVITLDPNSGYDCGSEVRYNNGLYDASTITEGFTRFIYFEVENNPISTSRLDYDFYSSNNKIEISIYGTVLAKPVDNNTNAFIYAIYKNDPSIIYIKEITILNDLRSDLIWISFSVTFDNMTNTYQIELNDENSAYPYSSYYVWELDDITSGSIYNIFIDEYGLISYNVYSDSEFSVIGYYKLNGRGIKKIKKRKRRNRNCSLFLTAEICISRKFFQ